MNVLRTASLLALGSLMTTGWAFAQNTGGIFQGRDHFLQAGNDDVNLGQALGQIAIALVGHDDRAAGLGYQEVRPRDPDVGLLKAPAQDPAGFGDKFRGFRQRPVGRQVGVMRQKVFALNL